MSVSVLHAILKSKPKSKEGACSEITVSVSERTGQPNEIAYTQ